MLQCVLEILYVIIVTLEILCNNCDFSVFRDIMKLLFNDGFSMLRIWTIFDKKPKY